MRTPPKAVPKTHEWNSIIARWNLQVDALRNPQDIDRDLLQYFAIRLEELHAGDRTHRDLVDDHWFVGLCGEWATALYLREPMNLHLIREGDGFRDFELRIGTLDVKTAVDGSKMLVKEPRNVRHRLADVFVMAQYVDDLPGRPYPRIPVVLHGWVFRGTVLRSPLELSRRTSWKNYQVPVKQMRPMSDLLFIKQQCRSCGRSAGLTA